MTDDEIEALAELAANTAWPGEQKRLLSISKPDWKAGFIAGFKKAAALAMLLQAKKGAF